MSDSGCKHLKLIFDYSNLIKSYPENLQEFYPHWDMQLMRVLVEEILKLMYCIENIGLFIDFCITDQYNR